MDPKRAARLLATLGLILMTAAFALRGLSLAATIYEAPAAFAPAVPPATLPARGHYSLSPDEQLVNFEQQVDAGGATAWFSMPLAGGPVGPGEETYVDTSPFLIRAEENMIFVKGENSSIAGSPPHTRITGYALSPDGKALAFSAIRDQKEDAKNREESTPAASASAAPTAAATPAAAGGAEDSPLAIGSIKGQWSLYVLNTKADLAWLGDFESLADLAWSPDGHSLAFIAPVNGTDQVFSIQASGQTLRQITSDASRKSNPVWSPDGQSLAYIAAIEPGALNHDAATPTPAVLDPSPEGREASASVSAAVANSEIYQVNLSVDQNASPRQLTHDARREYSLAWIKTAQGDWLTYAVRQPEQPQVSDLLAINPQTGQTRQIYPPLSIQSLDCPARIPANGQGVIHFTLTNNGLGPVAAPLQLRSGSHALPVGSADQKSAPQRAEDVSIQPGERLTLDWPVSAAPGLATHAAMQISQTGLPPMSEQHCQMINTRLGFLPNLRFLAPPVLLIIAGMLLCLPWLRQPDHGSRRSRWLWTAWAAAPVLLLLLVLIERLLAS